MRLKDVTTLAPQYVGNDIDGDVSFVPMESLRNGNIDYQIIPFRKAKGKYTYFGNNDLLVAKVTPCFENGNIAIAKNLLNNIGFGSSEIFILRPGKKVTSEYLFYLSQSGDFQGKACATMCGVGGLKRISPLFMRTYEFDIPTLAEQRRMVDYLDTKLSEIDRQVSLLTRKRDAYLRLKKSIINHAVTKGLDKNAKMKDSGIEWIGQVPEQWEVKRLKSLISIKSGEALPNEELDDEGEYPVYGGGDKIGHYRKYNTDSKEIIVGRVGVRCGCVTMPHCLCWATDNALKITSRIPLEFTYYALMAADLNRLNTSNAQPLITGTKIKNVEIPFPPLPEQRSIAAYLDDKCSKIDTIVANLNKQISRYGDLKRSLIDEVITGKRAV